MFFGWAFTINGILYVIYTAASGEWRHLVPGRGALRDALFATLHDLGLRKAAPPQGRYNAAQKFAYSGLIVMGAASVLTGLAIYKPTQLAALTWLLGGYEAARFEHFWLTVAFFVVHVAQVARAGWSNFRSMAVGLEPVADAPPAAGAGPAGGPAPTAPVPAPLLTPDPAAP